MVTTVLLAVFVAVVLAAVVYRHILPLLRNPSHITRFVKFVTMHMHGR